MSNLANSRNIRRRARIEHKNCGIGLACEILGDKWTILILREAFFNIIRFDDIHQDLKIPKSILSERLRKLVELDIFEKKPYRELNTRVRYSYHLSKKGRGLFKTFLALMEWGNEFLLDTKAKYIFTDQQTGLPIKLGLIDSNGQQVPQKSAIMKINRDK